MFAHVLTMHITMIERLGQFIRNYRKNKKMSQAAFARELDDTRDRVAKVELGIQPPDARMLLSLRVKCRMSIDRLFDRISGKGKWHDEYEGW